MNKNFGILLVAVAITGSLTACGGNDKKVGETSKIKVLTKQEPEKEQGAKSIEQSKVNTVSVQNTDKNSKAQVQNEKTTAIKKITYNDQLEMEKSISSFGKAIEGKDYESAIKYCAPELSDHIQNKVIKEGIVASGIDLVIKDKLPCRITSTKGYIPPELSPNNKINYNITKETPTTHFNVTFERMDLAGKKYIDEYYVSGVQIDGKWYIEGFSTGL